jgi:rubrerythrin
MAQTKPAVPELGAVEIHGISRQAFILRGALAAGTVYGAATVGPFVSKALAQTGGGDVEILNFALTLEYLEATFYENAPAGLPARAASLAKEIGANEAEHVTALTAAVKQLGGKPVAKPAFKFPSVDAAGFLKLAQTLEDTGVSAYNGAAPAIQSREVLASAGSIVQVEARHAAAVRLLNGAPPAPTAFDKALTQAQVEQAVKPFIQA